MADIYLLIEGKREGPFTETDIRESLAESVIPSHIPAWHEGLSDWISVGRLFGLPLASESAPPEQMETAPEPVATTNSQEVDLRARVLSLSVACPYDQGNPRTCPLHEFRKMSSDEKYGRINELSEMSVRDLLAFHQTCLEKKTKNKKSKPNPVTAPRSLKA